MSLMGCASIDRLVEEAMTGKYLHSNFSLPCPPGLDLPPEITKPFTSNNLKVNSAAFTLHTQTSRVMVTMLLPTVCFSLLSSLWTVFIFSLGR